MAFGKVTVASLAYSIVADVKGFVAGMNTVQKEGDETEKTFNDMANDAGMLDDEMDALAETYEMWLDIAKAALDLWLEQTKAMKVLINEADQLNMTMAELQGMRTLSEKWFGDPKQIEEMTEKQLEQLLAIEEIREALRDYIDEQKFLDENRGIIEDSSEAVDDLAKAWQRLKNQLAVSMGPEFARLTKLLQGVTILAEKFLWVADKLNDALQMEWMSDLAEFGEKYTGVNPFKTLHDMFFTSEETREAIKKLRRENAIESGEDKRRSSRDQRVPGVSFGSVEAYREISKALTEREKVDEDLQIQKAQLTEQEKQTRILDELSTERSGRQQFSVSLF